jgi:hypothetical protein
MAGGRGAGLASLVLHHAPALRARVHGKRFHR